MLFADLGEIEAALDAGFGGADSCPAGVVVEPLRSPVGTAASPFSRQSAVASPMTLPLPSTVPSAVLQATSARPSPSKSITMNIV